MAKVTQISRQVSKLAQPSGHLWKLHRKYVTTLVRRLEERDVSKSEGASGDPGKLRHKYVAVNRIDVRRVSKSAGASGDPWKLGPKYVTSTNRIDVRRVSKSAGTSGDPWKLRRKHVTTLVNQIDVKPRGVTFDVGYVDTGADWHYSERQITRTVLAVHGLPSTHTDLLPLVRPLHDLGCRVIAINLPGYEHTTFADPTEERFFEQSTTEMTEFLIDFLASLNVKELDVLVAHSAGALPSTVLAAVTGYVRSLVSVCALPGHTPLRGELRQRVLELVMNLHDVPVLKPLVRALLPAANRRTSRFACDNPTHLANVYRFIMNQEFELLDSKAMDVELLQIPFLYMCTKNDGLMGYRLSREWASKFGLQDKHFDEYDDDCNLVKRAESTGGDCYKKGVALSLGGHYPQLKTDTVLPILVNEIKHVLHLVSQEKDKLKQHARLDKT